MVPEQKGQAPPHGSSTAKGQDLLTSPDPDRAPETLGGSEQEAAQDSLLPLGAAQGVCGETLSPTAKPTFP